jgi:hypothetical protein
MRRKLEIAATEQAVYDEIKNDESLVEVEVPQV